MHARELPQGHPHRTAAPRLAGRAAADGTFANRTRRIPKRIGDHHRDDPGKRAESAQITVCYELLQPFPLLKCRYELLQHHLPLN